MYINIYRLYFIVNYDVTHSLKTEDVTEKAEASTSRFDPTYKITRFQINKTAFTVVENIQRAA